MESVAPKSLFGIRIVMKLKPCVKQSKSKRRLKALRRPSPDPAVHHITNTSEESEADSGTERDITASEFPEALM